MKNLVFSVTVFLVAGFAGYATAEAQPRQKPEFSTILKIKGMYCQSCVSMIKKTVRTVDGVQNVTVDLDSGIVVLEYDSSQSLSKAVKAITRMGYKVVDLDSLTQKENKSTSPKN